MHAFGPKVRLAVAVPIRIMAALHTEMRSKKEPNG